jgi:hypothetical protein
VHTIYKQLTIKLKTITAVTITAVAPQTAGKGGMAAVQMLNNSVQDNKLSLAEDLLKSGTNPIPMGPSQNTGNNFNFRYMKCFENK